MFLELFKRKSMTNRTDNRQLLKDAYLLLGDFLEAVPREKANDLAINAVVKAAEFINAALRNYPQDMPTGCKRCGTQLKPSKPKGLKELLWYCPNSQCFLAGKYQEKMS